MTSAARAQPGGVAGGPLGVRVCDADGLLEGRLDGDVVAVRDGLADGETVAVAVSLGRGDAEPLGEMVAVAESDGVACPGAPLAGACPGWWSAEAVFESRTGSPAPIVATAATEMLKRLSARDVVCFMRDLLLLVPAYCGVHRSSDVRSPLPCPL
jgi:hypothetical protein